MGISMADALKTNFIVSTITTSLQRVTHGDAKTWVLVTMRDDQYVDFKELRKALAEQSDRHLGSVFFSVRFVLLPGQTIELVDGEPFPQPILFQQSEIVCLAFEGIGREMGFRSARVHAYLDAKPRDWELIAAEFRDNADLDATAEELPFGDDLVEVYPVRTTMSRFENLSADYVIRIIPPLNEFEPTTEARFPESIQAHLFKINPERSPKVTLLVTVTEGGRKTIDILERLCDEQLWNKQLGLERPSLRYV